MLDYSDAISEGLIENVIFLKRSVAYFSNDNYEAAISDLKTVLKSNPNDLFALNNLAFIYATYPNSNYRNGEKALEIALEVIKKRELQKH